MSVINRLPLIERINRRRPYLSTDLYKFVPRTDNPAEFDQQSAFVYSRSKISICLGGTGSGKTAAAAHKTARFVLMQQPPPRPDTPFMIVSDTYKQVGNICWKEKLSQIIPPDQIDYDRCEWYRPSQNLPHVIALKPWPGTNNSWNLEFRSCDQQRASFQGRSIGGFWVSEALPFDIFEELEGRCRDYYFDGGQFVEFTPIDPDLAIPMEEKYQEWIQGNHKHWAFFRLNSSKNTATNAQWRDSYFTAISPEMMQTRLTGAFPSLRGSIYSHFNPAIHVLDADGWKARFGVMMPGRYEYGDQEWREFVNTMPPGHCFRRGIDWGESIDHPFVCLWGAKDGAQNWCIYDEYVDDTGTVLYPERAEEIKLRWPWPNNQPLFGLSYADKSRPLMIQQFSATKEWQGFEIPTIAAGSSVYDISVHNGIEYIRNLLKPNAITKRPGIYIYGPHCPRLVKEMRKYRWVEGVSEGKNPHAPQQRPLKFQDDTCFPAGELVDTPSGKRPIETIKAGDQVYSHAGIATVDIGATEIAIDSVFALTCADGRILKCTGEHLLWVDGKGWTEASDCLGRDVVIRCENGVIRTVMESSLSVASMADSSGGGIHSRRCQTITTRGTLGPLAENYRHSSCTSRCMRTISVPFQTAWSCTTRMKIRRTIRRTILSCSLRRSTDTSIQITLPRPYRERRLGIDRRMALPGTKSTPRKHGSERNIANSNASSAERHSKLATVVQARDSAHTNAGMTRALQPRSTTSTNRARFAGLSFPSTDTKSVPPVRPNVRRLSVVKIEKNTGKVAVYCLATSDGAFFVNGILVKNCDALRYMVMAERSHHGDAAPSSLMVTGDPSRHGVHGGRRR